MRWISLATFCFLIAIGASAWSQTKSENVPSDPPDAKPQYFPNGVFRDSSESGTFRDFTARWYAKHLRAMAEPSLSEASKDKTLVAYRFLWLRTFHHPIAVRLTIRPDGTGSLTGKVTNGAGGYEPGNLSENESVEVSKAQVEQFLRLLQKAAFWTSQTEETGDTAIGLDGAQWILEGVQNGDYHILDRWSPEKSDFATVCLYLFQLSRIKVKAKEIY